METRQVGLSARLKGLATILRPINCAMMGFGVFIGEFIAAGGFPPLSSILLGFFVGFLLTGGTMAINDYYDVEIDRVNAPSRPIPSGTISLREALVFGILLAAIGLLLAAVTNVQTFVVALVAFIMMVYYNTAGKRTGFFGNVIVSICVALTFTYGGFVVDAVPVILIIFSSLAFFSNLGREVTKGIADVKGDAVKRVKTIALLFGEVAAAWLASAFFILAVVLSVLPVYLRIVSILYVPLIVLSDAGFLCSSYVLLRDPSPSNAKSVKRRVLIWMLFGLLGFISGSLRI